MARTMSPPTAPRGFRRQKRQSVVSAGGPAVCSRSTAPLVEGGARVSMRSAIASVPDARVEVRVERVHGEVHEDDHRDDEEIDALDDGIVPLVDGVEEETSHAGQPEDRLEDHRSP